MIACPNCGEANPERARFCLNCATSLSTPAEPSREVRKTVTILFTDVSGSTALGERLDPESVRLVMSRYFAAMKRVLERHGGTVEKFIGDAIMAVFGIPTLHEDDALRAVRAADEMRVALGQLNEELEHERGVTIATRTGIPTGEVVAGDPSTGQTLVTGDTVNTAARLEQAAGAGEILLGETTWHLVRDAVDVDQILPIEAKGKARPVPANRLVSYTGGEGRLRHPESPLVGREQELKLLGLAYERAIADGEPQFFTLSGAAGVGKSRLVAEFLASIATKATVLKGHCLSYGEGITYWPLREIVHAAVGIDDGMPIEAARANVAAALQGAPDGILLASRIAAAIGLGGESAPQEEIFWTTRHVLEYLARDRPLVVLIEDIHWAEDAFLDLLEYLVDLVADVRILVLCTARPELRERRPGWMGSKPNAVTALLGGLRDDIAESLIGRLPGGDAVPVSVRQRIAVRAEGNPLFVEEMVSMLVDEQLLTQHDGRWFADASLEDIPVPASIGALLSARIDALPTEERGVAERASVIGRVFESTALRELAP
ncbi:MAG: hypothetical protein QOI09_184, partial [Chloroflexota bacterium]|nr:hypothetical protein [Chloroflexota bacterium]